MKRFATLLGVMMVFASPMIFAGPANAISAFSKEFKKTYSDKAEDADWYKVVSKAGCNVCHVKGHPEKKEARNEYGKAIHEFLVPAGFPKSHKDMEKLFKSDPDKAKEMLQEVFKKANAKKSADGKTFGEKIEAKKLPATDWQYEK